MRLIDADALYYKVKCECNPYGKPTIDFESGKKVLDWIEKAPTVERPHGEWIEINVKPTPFGGYTRDLKCNRCNRVTYEYQPNFCPHCGASMVKEGEAEC